MVDNSFSKFYRLKPCDDKFDNFLLSIVKVIHINSLFLTITIIFIG